MTAAMAAGEVYPIAGSHARRLTRMGYPVLPRPLGHTARAPIHTARAPIGQRGYP
jgi:hypothetical protein